MSVGVFWTLVALAVAWAWLAWCLAPTEGLAVHAAIATGALAALSTLVGVGLLRPRLELRPDTVVIVNPLATYRLPREDITGVTHGLHGAEFHRRDGFKTNAVALIDSYAGVGLERLEQLRAELGWSSSGPAEGSPATSVESPLPGRGFHSAIADTTSAGPGFPATTTLAPGGKALGFVVFAPGVAQPRNASRPVRALPRTSWCISTVPS
ncbi:PH domain-containing protein [Actinacidiphila rubida]|uniref:PH domain-containing protein n=1 Tax=Actinacidiphila rubida TaxID=310780 RepID=A0A1H8LZI4_9ACTN|nr:PH domain-containing protein [Actinacidiphila rubida]